MSEFTANISTPSLRQFTDWRSCPAIVLSATLAIGSSMILTSTTAQAQQAYNVEFTDLKISIQANDASLKDIMLDIQEKTGIPVNFVSDSSERVSLEIYNQPLEAAIGKLTSNHMIVHDLLNGKKQIKELIIFSNNPQLAQGSGGSQHLPTGQLMDYSEEEQGEEQNANGENALESEADSAAETAEQASANN